MIDNTLSYAANQTLFIYDLFNTRYRLFRNIYLHRVSLGIEAMICDALALANDKLHLDQMINDPDQYINLTDNILKEIERYKKKDKLKESNMLLDRIKIRDIYKYVKEIIVDNAHFSRIGDLTNISKFIL